MCCSSRYFRAKCRADWAISNGIGLLGRQWRMRNRFSALSSRPNLYTGRGRNTLYFPIGYKSLLSEVSVQEFLFIGDRPRKLKTFEAASWPPPIARKPRTDARLIANALLLSVVGNTTSMWNQVRFYFVNFHKFNASLTKATSHRFVDLLLQSFTGYASVAVELLPCFSVFAFQICKRFFNRNFWSACTRCGCGNWGVAFGAWLLIQLLRRVLRDKVTPLYLVICFCDALTYRLLQNDRTCFKKNI